MTDDVSLDELLSVWQQEQARGRDLPAAALCRDRPELAPELQRRIEAVRRMSALARGDAPAPVPVVPLAAPAAVPVAALLDSLRQCRLLESMQLQEVEGQATRFADAKALAGELIRRGWLTPYQVNQLLHGRGRELLLGSYILLERLGEGGMGQVFKARNWKLGRVVAVKLIRPERLAHPDAVRRFRREVQAAAALSHANIVHAYDADEIGGTHLLVMECVEGANDLARLVKERGPLPVAQACEYIRQAALGLQHAYKRGLVHRDIKPHNLLLTADGRTVKILDMGLARLDRPDADGEKSSTMTQEGAVMGTPDYIAPEQVMGSHDVDIRADLYSLGCTFYQLLTGRVPFPGGTLMQKFDGQRFQEPAPIENFRPDVPPAVAAVVRQLMAKKPEERYQTPAEVVAALAALTRAAEETSWSLEVADGTSRAGRTTAVAADRSGDTVASPFADLDRGATAVVVAPAAGPGAGRRRWLLPAVAGGALAVAGLVTQLIVPLHRGAEPPPEKAVDGPGVTGPRAAPGPRQVDEAWLKKFAGLPAEQQVAEVVARLKELNSGFDGKETHKIDNGIVIGLVFQSDDLAGISPVQALTGLKEFGCRGSDTGKSKLVDLSPLEGLPLTYFDCSYTQVSDLSPLKDMPLTVLYCGGTRVKDLSPLRGKKLEDLLCNRTQVSDLSPLKDAKLRRLACPETQVADLSPLKGLPLEVLECNNTAVSDLSPLNGMKLTTLVCYATKVADLSPLKDMPLTTLSIWGTHVEDLSPLKGMKLETFVCNGTPVADLSPLTGMPLKGLYCAHTRVSDLSPLKGMPLGELDCQDTEVSDLSPLKGMPLIMSVTCPFKPERDSEVLRSLTTLTTINGKPVREFWKEVEATKP
jgi:Leucine-rich repeat (LRR) protein/tRNA A-37 threonylcarbamoyl transferase component Bud32